MKSGTAWSRRLREQEKLREYSGSGYSVNRDIEALKKYIEKLELRIEKLEAGKVTDGHLD